MNGPAAIDGFLLYAVSSSNPDTKHRVGKFTVPGNAQNNNAVCSAKGFTSDDANSSLTHSIGQQYTPGTVFQFTAPTGDNSGDLTFHAIVVQKASGGGFNYGVFDSAAVVKGSGGGGGGGVNKAAPDQYPAQNTPAPGVYGQPSSKGVSTVLDSSTTLQPTCTPTTITQPPVTVTVTVTASPITKIRKCKPISTSTTSSSVLDTSSTIVPTPTASGYPQQSIPPAVGYPLPTPPPVVSSSSSSVLDSSTTLTPAITTPVISTLNIPPPLPGTTTSCTAQQSQSSLPLPVVTPSSSVVASSDTTCTGSTTPLPTSTGGYPTAH